MAVRCAEVPDDELGYELSMLLQSKVVLAKFIDSVWLFQVYELEPLPCAG